MLKKQVTYLLLLFFLPFSIWAQTNNTNQLLDSLNLANQPQAKAKLAQRIALSLANINWERTITYLDLAEEEAKKGDTKDLLAETYKTAGKIYSSKEVLDVALDYYLKAYDLYQQLGNNNEASKLENNLAIIYARLNNKDEALMYFKKVYQHQAKNNDSLRLAQIFNNIGTLYLEKNLDSCISYYQKSLQITQILKDTTLFNYLYTNLGRAHLYKNQPQLAKSYFGKALNITKYSKSKAIQAFVYESSAEYYLEIGLYDSALYYSNKTLALLGDEIYNFSGQKAVKTLFKAYIGNKEFQKATTYFEQYNTISDSLNIEEKAVNVERLKLQQEFKNKEKIQQLNQEKKRFKYLLVGISLVMVILILLLFIFRIRGKMIQNRLERELLESKQQELKNTLESKNKVLIAKAMTEMNRTDIINSILQDLKEIKLKAVKKETQEAIDFILKRLQRDLNTDTWQEFELSFEQVHQSFYNNLNQKHPDLTPKDRRLCALLLLDLTSKEISQITGQSFKAIENSRTRLRKKLNLTNTSSNLSTYLNTLSED